MKSKHSRLVSLLVGAVLGSAMMAGAAQAKDWKTVTIALDGSYAPWNLTLPGGKLGGFEPELVENLCAHAQLKCNLVTQDWDGMIPGLQAGKFDILMDAISITPDREKILALSQPYAATPATFAVADTKILPKSAPNVAALRLDNDARSNAPAVEDLRRALKGKTIGLQSGTIYTAFVNNNFKDVASIRVYKSAPERDLDLANGRIDASFDDITYYTANQGKTKVVPAGPVVAGPIWGPGEGLAFRKTDTDLKAKFDSAITAAKADGTIKKLALKWFKTDVTP